MINKDFCLSSYMTYRYIYDEGVDFYEGFEHRNFKPIQDEDRVKVKSAQDIDEAVKKQFEELYSKYDSIGILLSGGMDSAILASYLKPGSFAYTFSTELSEVFDLDKERAQQYCKKFQLNHKFIDISFDDYKKYTPVVMKKKYAPVHSIEPQLYKAALQAKEDGVDLLIVGESADLRFGGMDQLLSKDWSFDEFVERYTFLDPKLVLTNPVDVSMLFERYRSEDGIQLLKFMDKVYSIEGFGSYMNAFETADIPYYDPYAKLIMQEELDLERVRNGEPKYLIRELFAIKYPELEIPKKIPMPRPVDMIFKDWKGPKRHEFRNDIPMEQLTGNQKWQLWCAELFLDMFDK